MLKSLLAICLVFLSFPVSSDNLTDSNTLFDWAESHFPQYFSPSGQTTTSIDNYLVRYYPETDIYIGTQGQDVYVYGDIFGGLLKVGQITDFIQTSENQPTTMCSDLSGIWTFTLTVKCDGNRQYTMSDSGPITQNNCEASFTGSEGDNFNGTVTENQLNFTATYYNMGSQVNATGIMSLQSNGQLFGDATTNLTIPGCESQATVQGFPD